MTSEEESPSVAQLPYIRDAYIFLYARSDNPYSVNRANYFRTIWRPWSASAGWIF